VRENRVNKMAPIRYSLPLSDTDRANIKKQIKNLKKLMKYDDYVISEYTALIFRLFRIPKRNLTDKQLIALNSHYIHTWANHDVNTKNSLIEVSQEYRDCIREELARL
jgi:hypothetical protein